MRHSPRTPAPKGRRRRSLAFGLAALVLAATAGPALADFESALEAYQRGAHNEAYSEFKSLADAGDERAKPYLERLREQRNGTSVSNFGSNSVGSAAEPGAAFGSAASGGDGTATGGQSWSSPDHGGSVPAFSNIVIPYHGSVWSALFHLPGDATVIGLQHVASLLDAQGLLRDLQVISAQSDKILLSLLAAVWWLIILKGLWSLGKLARNLLRAATSPLRDDV